MVALDLEFDDKEVRRVLEDLRAGATGAEQGVALGVSQALMPKLPGLSSTIWNPQTGMYSSSWGMRSVPGGIEVFNAMPYSIPLEYGWTDRGGGFVSSPGVLIPALESSIPEIVEIAVRWLMQRAGL